MERKNDAADKESAERCKPPLLVSACLLGTPCRYDGASKGNAAVQALSAHFRLIPICPEVDGGLPTPRVPAERSGGRVVTRDGKDVTAQYVSGAKHALCVARANGCAQAVLKARSPSCGVGEIHNGRFDGGMVAGDGVAAELLLANGICILTEHALGKLSLPCAHKTI